MDGVLDVKPPVLKYAARYKAEYDLANLGISNLRQVYWNLPTEALYEEIVLRHEAKLTQLGPIATRTGQHTARAASDKVIVREPTTEEDVWWGAYNRPYPADKFDALFARLQDFLQGRDLFVQDCYVGAHPAHRMPVRIVTDLAWHSLFARNMFILPRSEEEYQQYIPEFTVLAVPSFKAVPQIDGTRTETLIALNFARRLCVIANTAYAGEIKKSVFTIMNYLLPLQGVLPMHCSANVGRNGDVTLFFGLSGTGKTTLSADPARRLVGDDEHGWNDDGVFNLEAGCYAKVIALSPTAEPQIYSCTRRFGTILENVVYDPVTRQIDLADDSLTENTRASYPLEYIENAILEKRTGQPSNLVLLTCDASGVLPPIAKLTPEQALYQFISGYTSKIAGTEVGLRKEPESTFSACFGAPFMVHHPSVYADLLKRQILRHSTNCWLVNTGWIGGSYGIGHRIGIAYTRAMIEAALSGKLRNVDYRLDLVFGFQIPQSCEGVPASILDPAGSWPDRASYMTKYRELASRFIDNFDKFALECPPEWAQAGPHLRPDWLPGGGTEGPPPRRR